MTSHVRHRRGPLTVGLIEPGELNVDTPSRQLIAGDIGGAAGEPVALLAVRFFDERASYALHDYAINAGTLYRALVPIPPGPFVADQWEIISGVSTGGPGGGGEHTPLHGFADGFNHTLLLHGLGLTNTTPNAIDFNNANGQTVAKLWATDLLGDMLRVQSAGKISLSPQHIGDDIGKTIEIDPTNVTIWSRTPGAQGGLVLRNTVDDGSQFNTLDWRNASNVSQANLWCIQNDSFWMQSIGAINFVPNRTAHDALGTVLQVNSGNVRVYGSLNVDTTASIGQGLTAGADSSINGNLMLGTNALVASASGFLHLQGTANLYLRSGTGSTVLINDTGPPTVIGGTLQVNGKITGGDGATFANDLRIYRNYATNTGIIYFGAPGTVGSTDGGGPAPPPPDPGGGGGGDPLNPTPHVVDTSPYLYYNGVDLQTNALRIATIDPIAAGHVATKGYVDAHSVGGAFLPLAGGSMTGQLNGSPSGDLPTDGQVSGSIMVKGAGSIWGAMSFLVPGVFGTNFGLRDDGNFYMGGWSHGSNIYKFWTSREVSIAPFGDIRLAFAADAYGGGGAPEPYPGAFVTGFLLATGLVRYRWVQVLIGVNWVTVATA